MQLHAAPNNTFEFSSYQGDRWCKLTFVQLVTAHAGPTRCCFSSRAAQGQARHSRIVYVHHGSANGTSLQYADIPSTYIASILEAQLYAY